MVRLSYLCSAACRKVFVTGGGCSSLLCPTFPRFSLDDQISRLPCKTRTLSKPGRSVRHNLSSPMSTNSQSELRNEDEHGRRRSLPWRILFFGTDKFSLQILQALNISRLTGQPKVVVKLEVISKKMCPVREYAEMNGLLVYDWPIPVMTDQFDVGVLASFGHLIPRDIINMFPCGILNVHPSLLPRWRGAAPILHTILNGDTEAGLSIMQIRPNRFDQGPVLLQQRYSIPDRCTSFQLSDALSEIGSRLIMEVLRDLTYFEEKAKEQVKDNVTVAPKIKASMTNVDWSGNSREQIDQQYRALHELVPLRSEWCGATVKLLDMVPIGKRVEVVHVEDARPGQPYYCKTNKLLHIRCRDGWVAFKNIVIKKPMSAQAFFNGYLSKAGSRGVVFTSFPNGLFLSCGAHGYCNHGNGSTCTKR